MTHTPTDLASMMEEAVTKGIERGIKNILPVLLELQRSGADRLADTLIAKLTATGSPLFLPYNALRREALRETVAFIKENLSSAVIHDSPDALRAAALSQVTIDNGLFLEFGVFKGHSINQIASLRPDDKIFGFDSFAGLPEAWDGHKEDKGAFNLAGQLPKVRENVTLVRGYFDNALPRFFALNATPIAFMHCDADLYSSTKTIFANCARFIQPGTVIVFDEFFNYPNWQEHEFKAFMEYCAEYSIRYRYIGLHRFQVSLGACRTKHSNEHLHTGVYFSIIY